jgi:hypothetical protein
MADQHFGDDFIDEWLGIGGHTPDANQLGFGFGEDQPVLSDVNRSFIRNKLQNADEHLRQAMDFSHDDVDIEQHHYERADESLSDYWLNQMDNDTRGYRRWLEAKEEEWMDENRPDAPTEDDLREQRFDRIRVAQNSAEGSHQSRRREAINQYDQAVDARARRMLAEYHAQQEAEGYSKPRDYAYQPAYRGTQRPQSFGGASTGGYNEMLLQRPNWELDPAKGHWANKTGGEKTIGHTRNMEFGRMGHLQESQSDMGQLARGYNLPPEVWRAQLDRTAAANGLPPLSDKQFETYRKNASLAGPMAGPFTDTEAWTQANVSMTMHEMAKARKDYFSWPNSADRLESASLSSEGRTKLDAEGKPVEGEHEEMGAGKITYDKYTTQAVKRAVESLGFKYEPEFYDPQTKKVVDTNKHKVEVYDVATGNNIEEEQLDPKIVTRVKLTPEIRAAIAQHGLPALSVAALAAGTASSAGSPGRSAPARPARVAGKKSLMD